MEAAKRGAPHEAQNRDPAALIELHFAHLTPVGFVVTLAGDTVCGGKAPGTGVVGDVDPVEGAENGVW